VAGAVVAAAGLLVAGCPVAVTVTVLAGVAAGVELPQAAASAATQARTAPAAAGRGGWTGRVWPPGWPRWTGRAVWEVRVDAVIGVPWAWAAPRAGLTSMTSAGPLRLTTAGLGKGTV